MGKDFHYANTDTYLIGDFRRSYNAVTALHDGKWEVEKVVQLAEGVQPQISVQELIECEKIVKKSKRVQELAAEVGEGRQLFA